MSVRSGTGLTESERGAGLLGLTAGFFVFMLLLLAAVQVLFNLYATSTVTAAAHDAAREVAGYDNVADRCGATAAATADFHDALGEYGDDRRATLTWTCTDPDSISVRVEARHPTVLPRSMTSLVGLAEMDRTITIRIEERR